METANAAAVRDVTNAEVQAYREQGWAKLEGFVSPDVVARLLGYFQERMGADASTIVDSRGGTPGLKGRGLSAMWQMYENPAKHDQRVRELAHSAALRRAG